MIRFSWEREEEGNADSSERMKLIAQILMHVSFDHHSLPSRAALLRTESGEEIGCLLLERGEGQGRLG